MRMRIYGSCDGTSFFEMSPGKYDKRVRLYGSTDNGETFFPIKFEEDYSITVVAGNARLGTLIDNPYSDRKK